MYEAQAIEFLERKMGGAWRPTIGRLYLPIFNWCLGRLQPGRTTVIGVNGPQGSGKSTLTEALSELFGHLGFRAISVSIDDFYLTRAEQVQLAESAAGNPYLRNRGYPGTHDLALGVQVLEGVRARQGRVLIPRFEKSLHSGKGDRLPQAEWRESALPLEVVFFEGWMLGYRSVPENELRDPALIEINRRLRAYDEWWSRFDACVQLKPLEISYVIDWRVEAEERMKERGKTGMSTEEARAYVSTFLPAYELYLPRFSVDCARLTVEIGRDRLPVG